MTGRTLNWLTLLIALLASAGSVALSVGLGLKACPLCFYQRTFAFGIVGVLLMGLLIADQRGPRLSLMTLPLAIGGLGVAVFHVYLELNGTLECPKGLFGIGTAPKQSLAAFVLLALLPTADAYLQSGSDADGPGRKGAIVGILLAVLLGALFTVACIKSAPPLPKAPTEKYDPEKEPLKGCRRPYKGE